KGVMLDQASAVKVQIFSGKAVKEGSSFVVPVELRSVMAGREFLNASASIHLVPGLPSAPPALDRTDLATEAYPSSPDEVYSDLLFHGPDFQGIEEIEGSSADGMIARTRTAPAPSQWIAQPLRTAWLTDPLAMDVSFQMMILWCIEHRGAGSLPCFAGRYRQFRTAFPKDGVRIVARVKDVSDPQVRVDFDFLDAEDGVVARLEDFECVTSASLRSAFRRKRLEPHAPNPAPASAEARSLPRSKD
ncbi:MAG: polyketide synthase dehydratase domain-containing protein, partial [Planctomycetota bacterium]|nr:polyketide synthase dehydratase domain-containing protein [Planctomycetota bacterium]